MEETANQGQETFEQHTESTEKTQDTSQSASTTTTEGTTQTAQDSFLEIKYNKEQIRLDKERAAELAQKGMNYDKAIERARQEARDAYIAEQRYEWNGKPITTESEYKQALREQELIEKYRDQGLPDEVVQELVESKKFREQYENERQSNEARSKQEADYKAFLDAFPDVKAEDIPPDVWKDVEGGKSLVDAYTRHENKLLKDRIAQFSEQRQIEQQNADNAASSTGSVTGKGDTGKTFFTMEQVQAMSQAEVNKNYKAILESQKQWYK